MRQEREDGRAETGGARVLHGASVQQLWMTVPTSKKCELGEV